jgi:hypothetical protein
LLVFTVLCAAALSLTPDRPFTPYFGRLPPSVALLVLNLLGAGALYRLQGRFGLRILDRARSPRAPLKMLLIVPLFAVPAILIDLFVGFPREINVSLPQALLFYPAIASAAEVTFHLIPLVVVLSIAKALFKHANATAVLRIGNASAAMVEPALQLYWGTRDPAFAAATLASTPHILAFNVFELHLFRRHDFLTMYASRLVYYLCWHILWGTARLHGFT